jgi:hypothetical protein
MTGLKIGENFVEVKHETTVKSFKKCSSSSALESNSDGSRSIGSNISDECDRSDKDFLGFHNQ